MKMKTFLFVCAFSVTNAFAEVPSEAEILEYVIALNQMHAEQDAELIMPHIPTEGFWSKYPDYQGEIKFTQEGTREGLELEWRKYTGWPKVIAVRKIERAEGHVDVTLAVTGMYMSKGKRFLQHSVIVDRLVSSDNLAIVVSHKVTKDRRAEIALGAERVADDQSTTAARPKVE